MERSGAEPPETRPLPAPADVEGVQAHTQFGEAGRQMVAGARAGLLVGAAMLNATTIIHKHLTPWLSSDVVPPENRNHGIASRLSLHADQKARELGYDAVYLFTPRHEALYARLGWERIEAVQFNGVELVVMKRDSLLEAPPRE